MIIFIWGPPQPDFEEGVNLGLEDNTPIDDTGKIVKEYAEEVKREKIIFKLMSRIGLGLVLLGFALQLFATLKG